MKTPDAVAAARGRQISLTRNLPSRMVGARSTRVPSVAAGSLGRGGTRPYRVQGSFLESRIAHRGHEPGRSGVSAERRILVVKGMAALCRDAATTMRFRERVNTSGSRQGSWPVLREVASLYYGAILLLAASIIAMTGGVYAAEVTGKWKSEFTSPIGQLKYIYDLKAEGEKLTGKAIRELEGQKTETEIKEGKVSASEVSFVELLKFDDQDIRIEYKGKLDGDEIKFTRKAGDFATIEIVAKRMSASGGETRTTPYGGTASKLKLKVVKVDSEETGAEDGKGANAVDGDASTIWHTQWQDASPDHPHEIIIELSAPVSIKGFTYLPRQDEQVNGTIKDYEFYLSNDGQDFGQPVKKGTFGEGKDKKTVTFDARQARFIKLKALSEINDQAWTSAAEIGVIQN